MENCKQYKKATYILGISLIFSTLLACAIPSTKEAAVIYLIPTIVNNEKVQNIGKNSLEILEKYTQDWIQDLTKKETKKNDKEEKGI